MEEEKKAIIAELKEETEEYMLEDFVDNYNIWNTKLIAINSLINSIDNTIKPYSYDEFCKKMIETTRKSLDNSIDYSKVFIEESEFIKVESEHKGDEEKINQEIEKIVQEKYKNNFLRIINKDQIKEIIKFKLKDLSIELDNI
jgi:hypothetical protein